MSKGCDCKWKWRGIYGLEEFWCMECCIGEVSEEGYEYGFGMDIWRLGWYFCVLEKLIERIV